MLDPSNLCFPNNVQDLLVGKFKGIDAPDTKVVRRPIRETDDNQTIGVFPVAWSPVIDSKEMVGRYSEPTFQRYTILVQAYVIDAEEERGIRKHALLSHLVRHTLYRDPALAVVLSEVDVEFPAGSRPSREFVSKWDVVGQDFQNQKQKNNTFIFLSTTEMYVETEFE
ncbi:hypothetical protein SEA_CAMERICO_19 [Gordonia phage Camerico]|nr:hypothetical protein SEA_CAMERICO_19 [Gordonia phage Camerico]